MGICNFIKQAFIGQTLSVHPNILLEGLQYCAASFLDVIAEQLPTLSKQVVASNISEEDWTFPIVTAGLVIAIMDTNMPEEDLFPLLEQADSIDSRISSGVTDLLDFIEKNQSLDRKTKIGRWILRTLPLSNTSLKERGIPVDFAIGTYIHGVVQTFYS